MQITKVNLIKGSPAYLSTKQLREYWDMGRTSMSQRIAEFKKEIENERYPRLAIIEDGHFTWINFYAFADYLANRKFLQEKHLRKMARPFDFAEWHQMDIVRMEC